MENNPNAPNPVIPSSRGGSGDYQSISTFIEKSNIALTNAALPAVAPLLEARGLSAIDITSKLAETEALRALNEKQKKEYGEQYDATEAYKKGRETAHEDYMDAINLARVAFKDNTGAQKALGLNGGRERSQSGYVHQALLFYNNAMNSDDFKVALAKKGVTEEELRSGQQTFTNLQLLTAAQLRETGEAQQATVARDNAYDSLQSWMSDFYKTAKVALRKHPQMMETLGIKEK